MNSDETMPLETEEKDGETHASLLEPSEPQRPQEPRDKAWTEALFLEDYEQIKALLADGFDPNTVFQSPLPDPWKKLSALHWAVLRVDLSLLRILLHHPKTDFQGFLDFIAPLAEENFDEKQILEFALQQRNPSEQDLKESLEKVCTGNFPSLVKLLLGLLPPNEANGFHIELLRRHTEHPAVVEALLDAKADLFYKDGEILNPLHLAVSRKHNATAELLRERGLESEVFDELPEDSGEMLLTAIASGNEDLVDSLLRSRADPNFNPEEANRADDCELPRSAATLRTSLKKEESRNPQILEMLLDAGAVMQDGGTDLMMMIIRRRCQTRRNEKNPTEEKIVRLLLDAKADPMGDPEDPHPLRALDLGQKPVLEMLLEAKADVAKAIEVSETYPLHNYCNLLGLYSYSYCFEQSPREGDFVKHALEMRVDPNLQDDEGNTALHFAARSNEHYWVEALLDAKADPCIVNDDGNNPLHTSVEFIDSFMLESGGSGRDEFKSVDDLGNSLAEIVASLLEAGLDPNQKNKDGVSGLVKVLCIPGWYFLTFWKSCAWFTHSRYRVDLNNIDDAGTDLHGERHFYNPKRPRPQPLMLFEQLLLTLEKEQPRKMRVDHPLEVDWLRGVGKFHFDPNIHIFRSKDGSWTTPLIYSILKQKTSDLFQFVLLNFADVNAPDSSGKTPVMAAVESDIPSALFTLWKAGADFHNLPEDFAKKHEQTLQWFLQVSTSAGQNRLNAFRLRNLKEAVSASTQLNPVLVNLTLNYLCGYPLQLTD